MKVLIILCIWLGLAFLFSWGWYRLHRNLPRDGDE